MVRFSEFTLDTKNKVLLHSDKQAKLSPKEFKILSELVDSFGVEITEEYIIKKVWGSNNFYSRSALKVYLAKIRFYLMKDETVMLQSLPEKNLILKVKNLHSTK
jgi:DNA-binding winged helix-turn-helix (wHTH) protein